MITFSGRGILLDIEGTTSSISFVFDVMFPYVRRELDAFLRANWNTNEMDFVREQMARDTGFASFATWTAGVEQEEARCRHVFDEVCRLMDHDVKATGLKQLQGLVWKSGFENGELQAHLYEDVVPALRQWSDAGLDLRVFSSGSVQAQKLFFGHTVHGNFLPHFQGHYDMTIGSKRESSSYSTISQAFQLPSTDIVFVSDVLEELDAAREAGMTTVVCIRPGNAPFSDSNGHAEIRGFDELRVIGSRIEN